MAMFGNNRPQMRPLVSPAELEASMGAGGAYSTQQMPPQGFGGPTMGALFNAQGRAPSALTAQMPTMSNDAAFMPNQQLQAPMQAQPQQSLAAGMGEAPQRGMFGRKRSGFNKFLNGAGKVAYALAMGLTYGPSAPFVAQKWRRDAEDGETENDLRRAQAEYYRAQAGAKDDGLTVVGNKLVRRNPETGMPEVVIDGRSPSDREQWLGELDDPNTSSERRANLERVLGITPAPRAEPQPQYQTDDAGNVFQVGPGGVRKIGGGLFKRPPTPPQPREPREPSIGSVLAPVVEKWTRGEQLTPTEAQALNWYQQNGRRIPTVQPGIGAPPAGAGPSAPPPTRRPPPPAPKLDANGNVPNPFGLNTPSPAPPSILRGPAGMPGRRNGGQTSGGRGSPAPTNPAQRRFGQIYTNPRGQRARWTAAGWEPVQ